MNISKGQAGSAKGEEARSVNPESPAEGAAPLGRVGVPDSRGVLPDSGLSRFVAAQKAFRRGLLYVVLSTIGLTMVLPFLWMLSTSLKTGKGTAEVPPKWIPRESATFAHIAERDVHVRVLRSTALVKRLDNGQETTVYQQALKTSRQWLGLWGKKTITIPAAYVPSRPVPSQ